jgi:phosphoserine phosphatase
MTNNLISSESEQPSPLSHPPQAEASTAIIPNDLVLEVQRIEQFLLRHSALGGEGSVRKIAAFDLDNTLLIGDIGEAVFAHLIADGYDLPISWSDYRKLIVTTRREAYEIIVKAMNGLSVGTVVKATHKVLFSSSADIQVPGGSVATPYAHPVMFSFVHYLRRLKYDVYILTASNEISARIATSQLFGIPESNVFGVRSRIDHDLFTDQLVSPPPIEDGKVEVYHRSIGRAAPFITAGDSSLDIPLLRLTDPMGLSIWVGEDRIGFQVAKSQLSIKQRIYFLPRIEKLHLEEERADVR